MRLYNNFTALKNGFIRCNEKFFKAVIRKCNQAPSGIWVPTSPMHGSRWRLSGLFQKCCSGGSYLGLPRVVLAVPPFAQKDVVGSVLDELTENTAQSGYPTFPMRWSSLRKQYSTLGNKKNRPKYKEKLFKKILIIIF